MTGDLDMAEIVEPGTAQRPVGHVEAGWPDEAPQDSDARLELVLPRLQLIEQPCVLDGDHGLLCKIGNELDLLIGEQLNVASVYGDDANYGVCAD